MSNGFRIVEQYGIHFVTFTVVGWVDVFTRKACKDIIIESLQYCQENKGLVLHAYVIMPSHLHLIIKSKESGPGLSAIIRDFKKFTSQRLLKFLLNSKYESRRKWLKPIFKNYANKNGNNTYYQLWQQYNKPKHLVHQRFSMQKLHYIHKNPVKDGIVLRAEDYLYSSARDYAGVASEPAT